MISIKWENKKKSHIEYMKSDLYIFWTNINEIIITHKEVTVGFYLWRIYK